MWPSLDPVRPSLAGREQLFEAVYQLLARWAEDRPLLLIVEDVHWLDRSSRDLLAFLVRAARRDRIVVLVTYRPDELHRGHPMLAFPTELERSGRARRIELEPLDREQVAEQIRALRVWAALSTPLLLLLGNLRDLRRG